MVLIVSELVVLELGVDLVVAHVIELAVDKAEEHRHIRVVVQWHADALLDEEQD